MLASPTPISFGFTSPVVPGIVARDSMDGGLYLGKKALPYMVGTGESTLSTIASLLGGFIVNQAPPPLAPGENPHLFYRSGQRRCLGVAPFLKVLPW
jgi:hypothetical protein